MPHLTDGAGAPLLASNPAFAIGDRDELADELARTYRVRGCDFAKREAPFLGVANRVQLSGVTLHYCSYSTATTIDFAAVDGFRQFFCVSGAGEVAAGGRRVQLDRATSGIVPPDQELRAAYGDGYAQLVLQFDLRRLLHKAELIEGRDFSGALRLPALAALDAGKLGTLASIAMTLAQQFSEGSTPNGIVVSELTQALVSAFLIENASSFPEHLQDLPKAAGRIDAARLEDYIHANWNRPLTVEDVAAACGVSVRSVFAQFKQRRGVSPMAYIRDVRLDPANRLLLNAGGPVSVIDIAMACGFASLGHFARRYRDKFGELPSATVARGRTLRSRSA